MFNVPDIYVTANSNVNEIKEKIIVGNRTDNTLVKITPTNTDPSTSAAFLSNAFNSGSYNLVKAVLPAHASLLAINYFGLAASNAATTAVLNVGAVIPFTSITSTTTTATVTTPIAHGLNTSDTILVADTGVTNFNSATTKLAVTAVTATTFTYTISSTAATSTVGCIVCPTYFSQGGFDVKGSGLGKFYPTNLLRICQPNIGWQPVGGNYVPVGADVQVVLFYSETGTASTAGGPWTVVLEYTN